MKKSPVERDTARTEARSPDAAHDGTPRRISRSRLSRQSVPPEARLAWPFLLCLRRDRESFTIDSCRWRPPTPSPAPSATPAAGPSSSAAGCVTGCSATHPRISTSKSSASFRKISQPCSAAFGRVEAVGQSFPVYKLIRPGEGGIDVALPRRESKRGPWPQGIRGPRRSVDVRLRDASRRRDFTINAISWDPLTGRYEDPFDGPGRSPHRILRAVDLATFGDDSLRVLRAIQFAARFEFTLDDRDGRVCPTIPLDDLPAERVWGEIEKLLLQASPTVDRAGAGAGPRRGRPALPGVEGAGRLRAGTGMAS